MSKRYPGGIIRKTPQTPSQTSAQGIWDMASVTQAVKENTWPIAGVPDPISKSLRFRSSASAYLNRTPASAGNQQKYTFSCWIKRGNFATDVALFTARTGAAAAYTLFYWNQDRLQFLDSGGGNVLTTSVYRDLSAWYSVMCSVDTTQATASDRVKIYVNGLQVTALTTANYPALNANTNVNTTASHIIGMHNSTQYFDGYLAEVNFIDGQALTPSSFGGTNDQTGVWQPIAYTGTYGTNGFYLPFSNTASTTTLGYDFSGNSNNWTTNNISLTSGTTYDSMVDVPTQWIPYNTAGDTGALFRGNYCTWNPLAGDTSKITVSDGNLNAQGSTTSCSIGGTMQLLSGKWYWEATITKSNVQQVGIIGDTLLKMNASVTAGDSPGGYIYLSTGAFYNNNTTSLSGSSYTTNDVISVAYDADTGKLWFAKNGTWQNSGVPASGTGQVFTTSSSYTYIPVASAGLGTDQVGQKINFGQQPFSYTPPAGFKTLCTTNLSTPTIGATASTTANKYFDALLYTGNGTLTTRTGLSLATAPGLVWIKSRSAATSNVLEDSNRGTSVVFADGTNSTNAEGATGGGWIQNLSTTGFSTDINAAINTNGATYVSWVWAGASNVTNTAGSITSTVSANTTAGFSIVTYTGNGTNGASIGHGLGVTPAMVIMKTRSAVDGWVTYHQSISSPTSNYLVLNTTAATAVASGFCTPSSSTITFTTSYGGTNGSGVNLVAYCFAAVAGYSAFGSYTGNGSSDGPFVFCGFRPRFVMTKRTDSTSNWWMIDTARSTYNQMADVLLADSSGAEFASGTGWPGIDYLSNGFKLRGSASGINASGGTYIYMAFAESPFKYALAR